MVARVKRESTTLKRYVSEVFLELSSQKQKLIVNCDRLGQDREAS